MSAGSYMTRISRVIDWYRNNDKFDPTRENLELLNAARRKLACALVELGHDTADCKAEKEKSDFNRKKNYADRVLVYRIENLTVAEAESKARIDNSEHEDAYCAALKEYEQYRLLYETVGEILNSISSEIRTVENEYRRINQHQ